MELILLRKIKLSCQLPSKIFETKKILDAFWANGYCMKTNKDKNQIFGIIKPSANDKSVY